MELGVSLIAYLGLHFLAYVFLVRKIALLARERGVFLYHLISAAGVSVGTLFAWLAGSLSPAMFTVCTLAHAVYSTTFLWVWSVTQDGYTVAILDAIWQCETTGSELDFESLQQIGHRKQTQRLSNLERLGIVARHDGRFKLTLTGRVASIVPTFFATLANIQLRE